MINIEGVSKAYNNQVVLQQTNLTIPTGKITAFIGPSGCGKSTILKILLGLIEPSSGRVKIDGEVVDQSNCISLRRKIGYVIQEGGLFPHLTARNNILLLAKHLKLLDESIELRLKELTEMMKLPESVLNRYPVELSGGQRQRVSLMRALILDPEYLLMDEPFGALDPMVRSSLQTELKDIFGTLAKTVLFVTHDMGEACYLADEIVLFAKGRVIQKGNLEELRDQPVSAYVTEFINSQRALIDL